MLFRCQIIVVFKRNSMPLDFGLSIAYVTLRSAESRKSSGAFCLAGSSLSDDRTVNFGASEKGNNLWNQIYLAMTTKLIYLS